MTPPFNDAWRADQGVRRAGYQAQYAPPSGEALDALISEAKATKRGISRAPEIIGERCKRQVSCPPPRALLDPAQVMLLCRSLFGFVFAPTVMLCCAPSMTP